MIFSYKGLRLSYEVEGKNAPIILLHGWGMDKSTFSSLKEMLKKAYTVYLLDFIGFGKSDEPQHPFSLDDYTDMLRSFIKAQEIKDPIILAHSFGGRVAIKYAAENSVKKLILVDSAGIKRNSFRKMFRVIKYKILKMYFKKTKNVNKYNDLLNKSGSTDYKNASSIMKGTLSKVVKEDLKKEIKQIDVETLIIWGKDDKVTPYKDAIYMKKHIKKSGLVTFNDCGHFPYLEKRNYFHKVIASFLEVEND